MSGFLLRELASTKIELRKARREARRHRKRAEVWKERARAAEWALRKAA